MWSDRRHDKQLKDCDTLADEAAIDAAFAILAAVVVVLVLYLAHKAFGS